MKNWKFENEISEVLSKYHCFSRKVDDSGSPYLKGILDIPNDIGNIVGSFSVEIYPTEKFPYRFPKLFEVGNDIPREADWHKYSDNSCCLTVEPDEILKCKNGMSIIPFIDTIAIPYFANQLYRIRTGGYLNEYSHGEQGYIEFFTDLIKTKNQIQWCDYVKFAFGIEKKDIGRNEKCFCGSGMKFKNCHNIVFDKIRQIGKENILNYLSYIAA